MVFQGGIHNVGHFIPGGITFPLNIVHTSPVNRAYVDEPFVAKLAPVFQWKTILDKDKVI